MRLMMIIREAIMSNLKIKDCQGVTRCVISQYPDAPVTKAPSEYEDKQQEESLVAATVFTMIVLAIICLLCLTQTGREILQALCWGMAIGVIVTMASR
ncbi:hypothetical protein [Pantoea cypripedii]|uniref:Uncharacterized protein n=1 Tax=Pantoea cypripedii TaxID=55209 RepID=A0A1X1ESZ4_PANCY|nr:hypothetical protein [Pantoea cypripedii]MBP2197208.1 hypothetical protein [Pantoea cypripedii]ORM93138.1 hypothetical protein HA50_07180 [Pantoea cypripedii]